VCGGTRGLFALFLPVRYYRTQITQTKPIFVDVLDLSGKADLRTCMGQRFSFWFAQRRTQAIWNSGTAFSPTCAINAPHRFKEKSWQGPNPYIKSFIPCRSRIHSARDSSGNPLHGRWTQDSHHPGQRSSGENRGMFSNLCQGRRTLQLQRLVGRNSPRENHDYLRAFAPSQRQRP